MAGASKCSGAECTILILLSKACWITILVPCRVTNFDKQADRVQIRCVLRRKIQQTGADRFPFAPASVAVIARDDDGVCLFYAEAVRYRHLSQDLITIISIKVLPIQIDLWHTNNAPNRDDTCAAILRFQCPQNWVLPYDQPKTSSTQKQ